MKPRLLAAVALVVVCLPVAARAGDPFEAALAERRAAWARDAKTPAAALAVLGALDLWDLTTPAEVAKFLGDAATLKGAHPLAQAHAAYLAELAAARTGDAARAAAYHAPLGFLEHFRVIGPFGFDGADNHNTAFGPEAVIADHERGKRGDVAWREVPATLLLHGVVPLGAMLRPDTQAAAYGLTWVYSPKAREVAVRVGSTGRIKVWIGGRQVLARDVATRLLGLDQDVAAAKLEAGWNAVLVKVTVDDGGWAFLIRLTELDGRPLALRSALQPEAKPEAKTGGKDSPDIARPAGAARGKPADLRALLTARTKQKGKAREAAYRALAQYLATVAPDRPDDKPVESLLIAVGLDGADAEAATLLLLAREAETPDVRRRAAERAAAAKGATPRQVATALTAVGAYYADEAANGRRARELYGQALAADPDYWPAELRLSRELGALELGEVAYRRVAALAGAKHAARLWRELAELEDRRGRRGEAQRLLAEIAREARDDAGLLGERAALARDLGDTPGAVALLREAVVVRPFALGTYLELGDALLHDGDLGAALGVYDAALAIAPDDARALETSGRALHDKGNAVQQAEGIARLKRALAVRPQNPELRQYLARVQPADDSDLEKQYARNARAVIARYGEWNVGRDPATVLLDLEVIRVHENGLSETYVQRIIRIDDENGASAHQVEGVQYSPETQSVDIRTARVFKASGELVEAKTRGVREVSEPWYGLYYDVRSEDVGFERLDPGDVVEIAYVLSDDGGENLLGEYFGDLHFLAEDVPRAEQEYTLLAPLKLKLSFHAPELTNLVQTRDEVDGPGHREARYRFVATEVPKVQFEGGMPGWTEVTPFLHVSTYRSWDEVARWYWGLIKEQLVVDDAIRKATLAAVKGLKNTKADEAEKVRRIHNLVVKSTRYVGLEFGIHGFKPYRTSQVYARKFGDCKDKASLIIVMLREVGIKAHLVLVRTRKNGDVGEHPASLAVFDHAIAYVPSLDLFLDGTAEFSGSGELPFEDQGVSVLVIDVGDGGDGTFRQTPVLDAAHNHFTRRYELTLAADGTAQLVEDATIEGQAASQWRQYYQSANDRRDRYEKVWNAAFAGAHVDKVELPDLAQLEQPVKLKASGSVPALGQPTGAGKSRVLPAFARPSELARAYARTSKRQHDLVLDYPWLQDETVEYVLPPGKTTGGTLPQDVALKSDFGSFGMRVKRDGQKVTMSYTLRIDRRRVTPAEYDAWRRFLLAVDAALNQPLELAL